MNYVFDIGGKKRAAARYIGDVRRGIIKALAEAEDVNRSEVARRIGCHRSLITRRLKGTSDLTLRSIAEIAWALGKRPRFVLEDIVPQDVGANDVQVLWDYGDGGDAEFLSGKLQAVQHKLSTATSAGSKTDAGAENGSVVVVATG